METQKGEVSCPRSHIQDINSFSLALKAHKINGECPADCVATWLSHPYIETKVSVSAAHSSRGPHLQTLDRYEQTWQIAPESKTNQRWARNLSVL